MGPLDDAKGHLVKAEEFLLVAEQSLAAKRFNAAGSDAVISAINSKDAICLKLVGKTVKAKSHDQAVDELKATGKAGAALAPTLRRVIPIKTPAQYQATTISASTAAAVVKQARLMYEGAKSIVNKP